MRVAALLFLLGIGVLTVTWLSEGSTYYIGVSEALDIPSAELTSARIYGTVQEGTIQRTDQDKMITFILEDSANKAQTIQVTYFGTIPDTFQAGSEVFVEGKAVDNNHSFQANNVVTKCPSKYQKENRS